MAAARWFEAEPTVIVIRLFRRVAVVFMLLVGSGAFLMPSTATAQTDADWDWMRENFGPALDALMPVHEATGMYVVYRSHHSLDTKVIEYSFVLGYGPKTDEPGLQRDPSGHVRMADSISIYDQMMKMHRDNPQEAAASIRQKVRIKAWDFSEHTCPAIQSQMRKFRAVRFGPPDFWMIILDPLVHEFTIDTSAGSMDISLADQRDPLIAWAMQTRRALDKCAAQQDGSSVRKR
jgi:hypothetical protein